MSRAGAGPVGRARALRDKLKAAQASGSSAAILEDGLLDKASKIQGFLSKQRQRTGTKNAKTEWLLAAQQLQDEREAAERELMGALVGLTASLEPEICQEGGQMLESWHSIVEGSKSLRQELGTQLRGIAHAHGSIKAHGRKGLTLEATTLHQGIQTQLHDEQQHLAALTIAADEAAVEVRSVWPSALQQQDISHWLPEALMRGPLTQDPGSKLVTGSVATRSAPGQQNTVQQNPQSTHSTDSQPQDTAPQAQQAQHGRHSTEGQQDLGHEDGQRDVESTAGGGEGQEGLPLSVEWSGVDEGQSLSWAGWAGEREELERMVLRFPLAEDSTKARVRVVLAALRDRHAQRLDGWGAEASTSGVHLSPSGGWPEGEHLLFVSLRQRFFRELGAKGVSRESLMRKLGLLMPQYPLPALMAHDDWHTAYKLMMRKRKDLTVAWTRERTQFLADSAELLQESSDFAASRAAVAADRLAHELAREVVRDHLDALRALATDEAELAAEQRAAQDVVDAELRLVSEATARAAAAYTKELVAEYRAELAAQAAEALAAEEDSRAAAAPGVAQQASHNRDRVEWRKAEYLLKQDHVRAVAEAEGAEAAAREARLDRLRALVAPDVAADPARVLLPTEASSAVDEERVVAFRAVNGYTVDQVYRDQRFKVMEALTAAGLQHTSYARQMVAAAPAATTTRMDNLTYDQRKQRQA